MMMKRVVSFAAKELVFPGTAFTEGKTVAVKWLNADNIGPRTGDGQGEIAKAAEHVSDSLAGRRIQKRHGAAEQYPVNGVVDLGEFRR